MFHLPLRGNQISMEPRVRLLRARMMERGQGVRPRRSSQTAEALSAPTTATTIATTNLKPLLQPPEHPVVSCQTFPRLAVN